MDKKSLLEREIALLVMLLFVGMGIVPSTGHIAIEKNDSLDINYYSGYNNGSSTPISTTFFTTMSDNVMIVENTSGTAGDTGHIVNINGTWNDTIAGYSIAMYYDSTKIEIANITLVGTVAEFEVFPGFYEYWSLYWSYNDSTIPSILTVGALTWDTDLWLPPGSGVLFKLIIDIKENASSGGTILDLEQNIGPMQAKSIYATSGGLAIYPKLIDGILNITGVVVNRPPIPSSPTPGDNATGVERPPAELSVDVEDPDGDSMDVYIRWKNHSYGWFTLQTYMGVGNGTYNATNLTGNDWIWGNTTYTWSVNATDYKVWTNETYQYKTGGSRYDVNNDGTVNFQDAGIVWVHRTTVAPYDGIYDVNGDGDVNFQDAGLTWINRD